MIIVLIGPPFAGKDTQAKLLSDKLSIPVFSMGAIIRDAYAKRDPRAVKGFEEYSIKGLHVPIDLKFGLMKDNMDKQSSFILDNFPATLEDLEALNEYLKGRKIDIDYVFNIQISEEEMLRRITNRGRIDDNMEIINKRREVQDEDRKPVIDYFRDKGKLVEINGEGNVTDIQAEILGLINK